MGFVGGVIVLMFPFLAAVIGLVLFLFGLIGGCLVLGGISGMMINGLYRKETGSPNGIIKPAWNISMLITGTVILWIPVMVTLYQIIRFAVELVG